MWVGEAVIIQNGFASKACLAFEKRVFFGMVSLQERERETRVKCKRQVGWRFLHPVSELLETSGVSKFWLCGPGVIRSFNNF